MTAAKHPHRTATTATGTAHRGTAKVLRTAGGVDFAKPFLYRGDHLTTPNAEGVRFERAEMGRDGLYAYVAGSDKGRWMGGVATRFWVEPIVEAPVAAVEVAAEAVTVTEVADGDPMVDGKLLSEMTFAEVMKLAQHYRTPGRGTARIAALRAGVATAILAEVGELVGAGA